MIWILLLLVACDLALTSAVYRRLTAGDAARRLDEKVEPAMREEQEAHDEDDTRRSRAMEEGIENLMSYEVKLGRGRTSGGEV